MQGGSVIRSHTTVRVLLRQGFARWEGGWQTWGVCLIPDEALCRTMQCSGDCFLVDMSGAVSIDDSPQYWI